MAERLSKVREGLSTGTGARYPKIRAQVERSADDKREKVVLVSCGSFSPVTNMHLCLFETVKNHLHRSPTGRFNVVGGVISPVHQAYGKKGLAEAHHRLEMCRLATRSSAWIDVDDWEAMQTGWTRTLDSLKAMSGRIEGELGQKLRLVLVCGSDLLDGMPNEKIWKPEHVEEILRKFGVASLDREDAPTGTVVAAHPLLSANKEHIYGIPRSVDNTISSSAVRQLLFNRLSPRYLIPDAVADYIEKHGLYSPEHHTAAHLLVSPPASPKD